MDTRKRNNKSLEKEFFNRISNDNNPELDCMRQDEHFNIDGDTLIELANSISDKPIHTLILNFNSITKITGLKAIIDRSLTLKDVWLNYCDLTDDLIIELANDPKLRNRLRDINLHLANNPKITDKGLAAGRKYFSPSTILSILMNSIDDFDLRESCRVEALNKVDANQTAKRAKVTTSHSEIEIKPSSHSSKSPESSSSNSPRMFSKKPIPKTTKRKKVAKITEKTPKISKNR
jgi:hypothetical protein